MLLKKMLGYHLRDKESLEAERQSSTDNSWHIQTVPNTQEVRMDELGIQLLKCAKSLPRESGISKDIEKDT